MQRFLLEHPDRPFTCLRTWDHCRKIVQLKEHQARLEENSMSVFGIAYIGSLLHQLRDFIRNHPRGDAELAIAVVVDRINGYLELKMFAQDFDAQIELPACSVSCFGDPRKNPSVKNTSWITERAYVEAKKPQDALEMLLHSNGLIYEGIKSSFFGIIEEEGLLCVVTAPFELVLKGTVAEAVIKVCQDNHIPFRFKLVNLNIDYLVGAFLTSALRYVQPVTHIETEKRMPILLPVHPLSMRIRELLLNELAAGATPME